jgi:hypothetical protein
MLSVTRIESSELFPGDTVVNRHQAFSQGYGSTLNKLPPTKARQEENLS